MKALVTKASSISYKEIREFVSLEELLQFAKDNGGDLIISTRDHSTALDITIYSFMDDEDIQRVKSNQKKYADIDMEVKIYDDWVE